MVISSIFVPKQRICTFLNNQSNAGSDQATDFTYSPTLLPDTTEFITMLKQFGEL